MSRFRNLAESYVKDIIEMPPINMANPRNDGDRRVAEEKRVHQRNTIMLSAMQGLIHPTMRDEVSNHLWTKINKGYEIDFTGEIKDASEAEKLNALLPTEDMPLNFTMLKPEELYYTEPKKPRIQGSQEPESSSDLRGTRNYAFTGQEKKLR